MATDFKKSKLAAPSGASLRVLSRMPEGDVRAVVQINHGMAEHAARYGRFARALGKAGYGVFVHDQRGHGMTTAPDAARGVFAAENGFDAVISDVLAVNTHIRARAKNVPVVCFGHSMGSIIALNFALRHPEATDALACWNSGVETGALARVGRMILRAEKMIKGREKISAVTYKLTFEAWNNVFKPVRTGFDWLSRDPAEVDKYVADPDCGFEISVGMWLDVLDGVFFAGNGANLKRMPNALPVHVQAGAADPCTNKGRDMVSLAKRLRAFGQNDVTLSILPETRHESLNETNRDQTTRDFIAWLDARFK